MLLADGGGVVQISLWGEIATRWQAPLFEALEAAEEGEWPHLRLECCEMVAVPNSLPSLPLRKLQTTGGTRGLEDYPGGINFSVFSSSVKAPSVVHLQGKADMVA